MIRKLVLLFACGFLFLLTELVWSAHTRTWYVHNNTTTTESQINSWHTSGTSRLKTDDDGTGSDDRVCCLTISKGTTETGWTYSGGDDVIGSSSEMTTCLNAMTSKNSATLTSHYTGSPGARSGSKIHIYGNPDCSTLVHEVGHIASNSHVSVDKRFMTPSDDSALVSGVSGRKHVSETEKTNYETLN